MVVRRFRVTRRLEPSCSCTNRGTAFKPTWACWRSIPPMPISTPCRVAIGCNSKLTLSDRWGKLEVRKAALIATDYTKVVVAAPTKVKATALSGDGWELRLEAGWKPVKGARAGDWKIV